MSKPEHIELAEGTVIPILYEDRSVIAVDKPAGWLLAPDTWTHTGRNLQWALVSSISAGAYWARSRHLKFIRYLHRLDAETTGVLLLARHPNVIPAYSRLFAGRRIEKVYLAVVTGNPSRASWSCRLQLASDPSHRGRIRVDRRWGKEAETCFRVLRRGEQCSLLQAQPLTGHTHQIRVHLAAEGHPVVGDPLYGRGPGPTDQRASTFGLGLRAISLSYADPFQKRRVRIEAPASEFCRAFGFDEARTGLPCP